MHRDITTSTQRGYYIVYLFSEDMQRLYLTIGQGVTETSKEEMQKIKEEIREQIHMSQKSEKDDEIFLGQVQKRKDMRIQQRLTLPMMLIKCRVKRVSRRLRRNASLL